MGIPTAGRASPFVRASTKAPTLYKEMIREACEKFVVPMNVNEFLQYLNSSLNNDRLLQ
jgi:hypothetical protein